MTLQRRVPWSGLTIDPKLCDAGAPSPGLWVDRLNLSFGSDLVPANSMHNMIGPCHASQPFSVLSFYTFFIRQNVFRAFCFKRHFALMAVKKCLLLRFCVFKKQKGNHEHLIVFHALQIVIKSSFVCMVLQKCRNVCEWNQAPCQARCAQQRGCFFSSAQTEGSQPSCESEPHLNVCCFPLPVLSLNRRCSVVFLRFAFSYYRCVMPAPKPYSSLPSPKLCVTALLNNILCYKIGVFEKESAVSPISQREKLRPSSPWFLHKVKASQWESWSYPLWDSWPWVPPINSTASHVYVPRAVLSQLHASAPSVQGWDD